MKQVKNTKTSTKKSATPIVARPESPAPKPAASVVAKQEFQSTKPVTPVPGKQPTAAITPVAVRQEPPIVKPSAPTHSVTVIEAKIDVGFGNNLFVRGQGAGLSWERGLPLTCVGPDTWRLTVKATDRLKFKLLLNDRVWASGEDIVVPPGKQVELKPAFSE
jgi:hypothetical protein